MRALIIFIFLLGFLSCNTSTRKGTQEKALVTDSNASQSKTDTAEEFSCARGIAKPVLKKSAFPDAVFQFGQDSFSAVERVKLKNGDSLTLTHGGCEYYILTFRFVYVVANSDAINSEFGFKKAIESMRSIHQNIDDPTDIALGINKLSEYQKRHLRNLQFGEEVDFGGEDIRSFVTVDMAERLPGNKAAVEISFSVGPL